MFFYSFIWVWTILNCHFIFRYRFHFKLHLPSVLTLNAWFSSFMALKWNSFCCHSFFFLLFCLLELLLLVEFVMFLIPTTFKFNYIYWIKTRENISSCFQSKIESSMQSCRHKHTNKEEKKLKERYRISRFDSLECQIFKYLWLFKISFRFAIQYLYQHLSMCKLFKTPKIQSKYQFWSRFELCQLFSHQQGL
jgi:hypothetical protein